MIFLVTLLKRLGLSSLCILIFGMQVALCENTLTGIWTVDVNLNSNANSTQQWYIAQQDNQFGAVGFTSNGQTYLWSGAGDVSANTFTLQQIYIPSGTLNNLAGSIANDFNSFSGTISDINSQIGTFQARRTANPVGTLTPQTRLVAPPLVTVEGDTASLILKKFNKISIKSINQQLRSLDLFVRSKVSTKKTSITVQYQVTVQSISNVSDRRRLTSKKNIVSFKNLPSGVYTSSYKVVAMQDGKKVFSTNVSPAATFEVQ